ncbi:MAG TPA: DoxX family protein [Pseudolabrys sp.]|nr:DoxX family protein [Pseudolabrys sp.]
MANLVDRKRLYVPAAGGLYDVLAPLAPTLVRVTLGAILIPHGFGKVFGNDAVHAANNFVKFGWSFPLAWAYFIGCLEFFGGIALVLGLFTRAIALAFAIEMGVIAFAVLWPNWEWAHHGMEYAVFMGLIAISILWRGSGPYALDNLMAKEF